MTIVLTIVLLALMAGVVYSLVKGIVAFMQGTKEDLYSATGNGPTPNQIRQNKAMMQRVLFQGAAIIVVALLLFATR
ncbi:hypoxia induced protein [Novosphingobium kunmingense]|uniref:Hypoxia induced protein n=1 Tax=Novosphingobium kunmingense TaxID=1211806 RepID=A0A2N0HK19_9SPHN|nr:twin transmembrane helix small protein [Novosphingobium kunmingense]PKB19287.1 hypoxia induced protein [Novosphingobium kunmingense]